MLFQKFKNLLRSQLLTRNSPDYERPQYWDTEANESEQNQYQQYTQTETSGFTSKEAGYYAALELKEGARFPEIKAAYKKLVKQYHPDKYPNDEQKRRYAGEVTQKLNEAYRYFEEKFGQK